MQFKKRLGTLLIQFWKFWTYDGDKMGWCDICERKVKGKTHKVVFPGYSLYLCDRHYKIIKKRKAGMVRKWEEVRKFLEFCFCLQQ